MDQALDRLSFAIGHRLPRPINLVVNVLWWTVFLLAMLSFSPSGYEAVENLVSASGINVRFPANGIIVPWMIGLTILQMVHSRAVVRRSELVGLAECRAFEPRLTVEQANHRSPRPTSAQIWGFTIVATVLFGYIISRIVV